ncbi:tRNA1(Val) (adenine(37)-N6)-methyltransferase [Marinobacterium litorale]|uniref:tRNA1(Val) (adenine(37)-N6)-methyltransferase n=1 Tax=Marinobacterium litorale TaxID=404770 RepID=UPI0003F83FB5|nr:methyltransferase [Marinobacterium litorale]
MTRRTRNRYFQCQKFRIEQGDSAMKVTTDACALGAWAPLPTQGHLLDIGTGTGLLALFAAQRSPELIIDAVELDSAAAAQARANFGQSPFSERLQVIEQDIRQYRPDIRYDCILSNPPFFSDSTPNRCDRLSQARHDSHLPLADLVVSVSELLASEGRAYLLLPCESQPRLRTLLEQNGLYLRHQLSLISQPGDAPHRHILTLARQPGDCEHETLTLYRAHPVHSREAGRLFYPFYTRLRCEDPRFERQH